MTFEVLWKMDMWPKLTNLKLRLMCRKGACLMSSNSGLRVKAN